MAALLWCGLLNRKQEASQIKLDDVKGSCERFMTYCSKIESFCRSLCFLEIALSLVIFIWSCLRCNPFLLKLVIGSKSIRQQQPSLQPVFDTAKMLRGSPKAGVFGHGPTLLFTILCYLNIAILTIDILYAVYLWIKIRKEVLFLHFESKEIASVEVRNIMISLAVTPMSAFCVSRYSYFNKYIASIKLNDALESVHLITKQSSSSSSLDNGGTTTDAPTDDAEEDDAEDDGKDEKHTAREREALYVLDSYLAKSKPFDMKDMEDVLELIVPTFMLWNLNVYLLCAGLTYLYIFCVLFIVVMLLVIWFKFSMNIGMITPILLPMSCLVLEFFAFVVMGTLSLLWYHQSVVAAMVLVPLLVVSVGTLFWEKNGSIHVE
eukprot:CAMPEP_0202693690 /NCGR_PEP_ID=MMETSP1385-20130828/7731_1 /ASSEMBLY_ACC=CAM_ASM_000861 /TAXON_ID=933848 /ORGANISM="Elphidium margaritaceum" /LENGTH=376 /DNA_ID=CAMNT_0049349403 /DNA_START=25 /DNA_END=1155 /DNA_ORIENTATION=-